MVEKRRSGHATAMAGEFFVMERLYRLGHQPALTLGNAKSIDILVRSSSGHLYELSVKAICGGGKWNVGTTDLSNRNTLVFVLLHYKDFEDLSSIPEAWVIPSSEVGKLRKNWFKSQAIYASNDDDRKKIGPYKEKWTKYIS